PATYKTTTHELRLATNTDEKTRVIAGMFYQSAEHDYLLDYQIPDISEGLDVNNQENGVFMGYSPYSYFVTDQVREVTEKAFFGELSYDVTEQLTITGGVRVFEIENKLEGVAGSVYSDLEAPLDITSKEDGVISKINASFRSSDNVMFYITYSEGFRAGGINRASTTNIPRDYESDLVRNHEIGWKSTLLDNRMRLNGALFYMDWEDMQIGRFDPTSENKIGLTANAGDAEVLGIEIDMSWLATSNVTIDWAASYIPTAKLLEEYIEEIGEPVTAPIGTRLPYVPDFKTNLTLRYQFNIMNRLGFFQASAYHTSDSYNSIVTLPGQVDTRKKQKSYTYGNMSVGIDEENWGITLYVNNVTDERAELYRNIVDYEERITTNRPRTIGLSFKQRF
ncbi:MAG: TonB-dependent receptor, partial [Alphaproteobacteria bacterium]|nr:TonB-dependent receptor [Alphaproteobacteria bacterium]